MITRRVIFTCRLVGQQQNCGQVIDRDRGGLIIFTYVLHLDLCPLGTLVQGTTFSQRVTIIVGYGGPMAINGLRCVQRAISVGDGHFVKTRLFVRVVRLLALYNESFRLFVTCGTIYRTIVLVIINYHGGVGTFSTLFWVTRRFSGFLIYLGFAVINNVTQGRGSVNSFVFFCLLGNHSWGLLTMFWGLLTFNIYHVMDLALDTNLF